MRFGVLEQARPAEIGQLARLEDLGYEEVWFPDSQLVSGDPYVAMALLGAATRRLGLCVGVTNPVTRHVTVTANAVATLNAAFPGRVALGLGTGHSAVRALGLPAATLRDLRESVSCCRALLRGEEAVIGDGAPLRFLRSSQDALNTAEPVPIRVAAGGPAALRLAGELADEVVLGTIDERLVALQLDHVHEGCARAGRSPDAVAVTVVAAVFQAGATPTVEQLVDHVGHRVTSMLVSNWRIVEANPDRVDPALRQSFERGREAFGYERAGGTRDANLRAYETYMTGLPDWQRELVDEAALRAKVLWGPPAEIRTRLGNLEGLGVGRVVLYPDSKDPAALDHFAEQFV
jgi:alkanesulfonate monooxygenase SsuD/methylene tetrahydromethanopterin reductase-like flavin-dependent oxidoreductase (luciferase family)